MSTSWKCRKCGCVERHKNGSCKNCLRISGHLWYRTNKERKLETARQWYIRNRSRKLATCNQWHAKHPNAKKAHYAINDAITAGKLKRKACEICGSKNAHAHHPNYNKPFDVLWLCKSHHSLLHAESDL